MVCDAEKYKEEDDKIRRVDAKNQYESYLFNMKSLGDEKIKDKFSEEDRTTLDTMIENHMTVRCSPSEDAETYESKLKECEGIASPIMTKIPQQEEVLHRGLPECLVIAVPVVLLLKKSI